MHDRRVSMFVVVFILPAVGMAIAVWMLMELGPLSTMLYFSIVAFITLATAVETLARSLPRALVELAEANCYRFDGTQSWRRTAAERKARRKLRLDLWALALLCLLAGGLAATTIHFYVIPIPVAIRGALSFSIDSQQWKSSMQSRNVDRDLERMLGSRYRASPRDANSLARSMWQLSPILISMALLLFVALMYLVVRGYHRALADYHRGLLTRQAKATERDVLHIQHQEERRAIEGKRVRR